MEMTGYNSSLVMEWEGRHSSPSSERSLEKTREGAFELEPGSRLSETIMTSGSGR